MSTKEARLQWEQAVSYYLLDQYGVSLDYLEMPQSVLDKWYDQQLTASLAAQSAIELFIDCRVEPQV